MKLKSAKLRCSRESSMDQEVEFIVGGREVGQIGLWKEFEQYEGKQKFWINCESYDLRFERPFAWKEETGDEEEANLKLDHAKWLQEVERRRNLAKMLVKSMQEKHEHAQVEIRVEENGDGERGMEKGNEQSAAAMYSTRVRELLKKSSERMEDEDGVEERKKRRDFVVKQGFHVGDLGKWDKYVHRDTGDDFYIHKVTFEISTCVPEFEELPKVSSELVESSDDANPLKKDELPKNKEIESEGEVNTVETTAAPRLGRFATAATPGRSGARVLEKQSANRSMDLSGFKPVNSESNNWNHGTLKHAATEISLPVASSAQTSNPKSASSGMSENSKERLKYADVIAEIISTEEIYYKEICAVLDIYVAWLRYYASGLGGRSAASKLGISVAQIDLILGQNLEEIRALSGSFLQKLKAAQRSDLHNVGCILKIFLEMSKEMHAYAPYNSSYSSSYMLLKKHMQQVEASYKSESGIFAALHRNKSKQQHLNFLSIWIEFSAVHLRSETMFSFLIKPVQRIPRYCLLLKELRKSCPPGTVPTEVLNEVCSVYETVTSEINQSVRAHEKLIRIFGEELEGPQMSRTVSRDANQLKFQNIYGDALAHPPPVTPEVLRAQAQQEAVRRKLSKLL